MTTKGVKKYAVIDIETTGGMAKRDKITEIAIVVTDGYEILNQYSTLINPERSIPHEITRITGITDEMVQHAPRFYEVAREIVLLTEGAIFVAHNVNFDYNFIRYEFERLGYTYSRKQLCTVKLSRKAFPGLSSYSLGNLIRHFGIAVNARHRALDDALAACYLLHQVTGKAQMGQINALINRGIRENKLPEAIHMERLHQLPEVTGVYYFYDQYGTIIYVGKSINIRSRILQHFGQVNAKQEKLMRQVFDLDFTVTGSELIALLLESEEIKIHMPEINKAQKKKEYPYVISFSTDAAGYLVFHLEEAEKKKHKGQILCYHTSASSARSVLGYMRELYSLCEEKIDVGAVRKCIYHQMGECYGACAGLEDPHTYNERAEQARLHLTKVFESDFVMFTEGRTPEETGLVWVENQQYFGYGFLDNDLAGLSFAQMKACIEPRLSTPEANAIIQQFLKSGKYLKYLSFDSHNLDD
jgi:DNA polymerase-3 subunit epsilon